MEDNISIPQGATTLPPAQFRGANQVPQTAAAQHLTEQAMADKINTQAGGQTADQVLTPVEEAPVTPPPPQADAAQRRLAILAREERRVLEQKRLASQAMQELKALQAEIAKEREFHSTFRNQLKTNPMSALEQAGITYEMLTEAKLSGKPITPEMQIQAVKQELDEAKRLYEQNEKLRQENEQKQREMQVQQVISNYKGDIKSHLDSDSSKFELLHLHFHGDTSAATDYIYQSVEEFFNVTGKTLTFDEACEMNEQILLEDHQRAAEKSQKLKGMGQPVNTQSAPQGQAQPQAKTQPGRTLTNQMNPSLQEKPRGIVSEGEAIKRALAKLGRPA